MQGGCPVLPDGTVDVIVRYRNQPERADTWTARTISGRPQTTARFPSTVGRDHSRRRIGPSRPRSRRGVDRAGTAGRSSRLKWTAGLWLHDGVKHHDAAGHIATTAPASRSLTSIVVSMIATHRAACGAI